MPGPPNNPMGVELTGANLLALRNSGFLGGDLTESNSLGDEKKAAKNPIFMHLFCLDSTPELHQDLSTVKFKAMTILIKNSKMAPKYHTITEMMEGLVQESREEEVELPIFSLIGMNKKSMFFTTRDDIFWCLVNPSDRSAALVSSKNPILDESAFKLLPVSLMNTGPHPTIPYLPFGLQASHVKTFQSEEWNSGHIGTEDEMIEALSAKQIPGESVDFPGEVCYTGSGPMYHFATGVLYASPRQSIKTARGAQQESEVKSGIHKAVRAKQASGGSKHLGPKSSQPPASESKAPVIRETRERKKKGFYTMDEDIIDDDDDDDDEDDEEEVKDEEVVIDEQIEEDEDLAPIPGEDITEPVDEGVDTTTVVVGEVTFQETQESAQESQDTDLASLPVRIPMGRGRGEKGEDLPIPIAAFLDSQGLTTDEPAITPILHGLVNCLSRGTSQTEALATSVTCSAVQDLGSRCAEILGTTTAQLLTEELPRMQASENSLRNLQTKINDSLKQVGTLKNSLGDLMCTVAELENGLHTHLFKLKGFQQLLIETGQKLPDAVTKEYFEQLGLAKELRDSQVMSSGDYKWDLRRILKDLLKLRDKTVTESNSPLFNLTSLLIPAIADALRHPHARRIYEDNAVEYPESDDELVLMNPPASLTQPDLEGHRPQLRRKKLKKKELKDVLPNPSDHVAPKRQASNVAKPQPVTKIAKIEPQPATGEIEDTVVNLVLAKWLASQGDKKIEFDTDLSAYFWHTAKEMNLAQIDVLSLKNLMMQPSPIAPEEMIRDSKLSGDVTTSDGFKALGIDIPYKQLNELQIKLKNADKESVNFTAKLILLGDGSQSSAMFPKVHPKPLSTKHSKRGYLCPYCGNGGNTAPLGVLSHVVSRHYRAVIICAYCKQGPVGNAAKSFYEGKRHKDCASASS